MTQEPDVKAMVAQAKKKGCFDWNDFSGMSLNMSQLGELQSLLQRKRIPFCETETEGSEMSFSRADALKIVTNLRRGVPAPHRVSAYSVGRESLVGTVRGDLDYVGEGNSRVRFLNGDYGRGKTHSLHLLKENAFDSDFVVSQVTLSPNDCPLHDFMRVYREVMRGIRTRESPASPAVESILGRWLEAMRGRPREQVREIVYTELPPGIKGVLAAYYDARNIIRPDAAKRNLIVKYLYGDRLSARELRSIQLTRRIDEASALIMLAQIAHLVRYIGYRGICILFDEAESAHSFAYYRHRDQAVLNLRRIAQETKRYPHCYFLYATTPSFFDSYPGYADVVGDLEVLELELLDRNQRLRLCDRIADIYQVAYNWSAPLEVANVLEQVESLKQSQGAEIGDLVRAVVSALDELRSQR